MAKNLKAYTGLGLLTLVALFILQNTERWPISFLIWEFQVSRALMMFIVFVIGVLVGLFTAGSLFKPR